MDKVENTELATEKKMGMSKNPVKLFAIFVGFLGTIFILLGICYGVFTLLSFYSIQGSGELAQEERELQKFSKIELRGPGELTIEQNQGHKIEIEAEENILKHIETKVKGNTLYIDYDFDFPFLLGRNVENSERIKLKLSVAELEEIVLQGENSIDMENIVSEELKVEASGDTEINIKGMSVDRFDLEAHGSVVAIISGITREQNVSLYGSGRYNALELLSRNVGIKLAGSGSIGVHATDVLEVDITGSGKVGYKGKPNKLNQDITGTGEVFRIDYNDSSSDDNNDPLDFLK